MSEWSHDYWTDRAEAEAVGMPMPAPVVYVIKRTRGAELRFRKGEFWQSRNGRWRRGKKK